MKKLLWIFILMSAVSCGQETSDDGTLIVWSQHLPELPEGQVITHYINRFNEEYSGKYQAKIEFTPRGNAGSGYDDKVNAAITAGDLPDVLAIDGPNVASFAQSGLIIPLNKYLTDDQTNTYTPSITDQGTINGNLYALGLLDSAVILYYNKDIFVKLGITPSKGLEDVWTWDDLYNTAKKIKDTQPDILPIDMHLNEWTEWLIYGLLPLVQSADINNKGIVSQDGLEVQGYLNSPAVKEALTFIQKLTKEGLTSLTPEKDVFRNGKAAMLLYGVWELENFKNNFINLNFGFMAYPRYPQGRIHGPVGSWTWAVTSSSKDPLGAAILAAYLSSTELTTDMSLVTGMPASHITAIEKLPNYKKGGDYSLVMDQVVLYGTPRPKTPIYPILSYQFQSAIQAVALGEDVNTVVEKMTQTVDKELQRFRK
ncbi:MAG: ABC transporter substrate-binding protein [Brevinema sp.]